MSKQLTEVLPDVRQVVRLIEVGEVSKRLVEGQAVPVLNTVSEAKNTAWLQNTRHLHRRCLAHLLRQLMEQVHTRHLQGGWKVMRACWTILDGRCVRQNSGMDGTFGGICVSRG